jgi:hypothetical protein
VCDEKSAKDFGKNKDEESENWSKVKRETVVKKMNNSLSLTFAYFDISVMCNNFTCRIIS